MVEENISLEFRLKNIDVSINYYLQEIKAKWIESRKHEKVCTTLNYIEYFPILASTITGCISIFAFASLIVIPMGIKSTAKRLKNWAIAAGTKKYESIINKKKKNMMK